MKILVGAFQCESNTFSAAKAEKGDFYYLKGEQAKQRLFASHIFEKAGYEVVPLVYAVSLPSGYVTKACFDEIMSDFRAEAAKHPDADGIYLYLHGAMCVEGNLSGEELTVRELRKTVGDAIPISLDLDFHANVSEGLVAQVQAISGYRTAPHTDYDEAETRAAWALMKVLEVGKSSVEKLRDAKHPAISPTRPHFFRIRVQFADAAQTSVEPYVSILKMVRELDGDPNVVSANVFNGQPWVDAPFMGASVVVYSKGGHEAVEAKARAIADYFEAHKTDLTFGVPALAPERTPEAVRTMAKPVFVSDSGDNTTAGAAGTSDGLVKVFRGTGLKTLFTSLCDPEAVAKFADRAVGRGKILGFVGEEAGEGVVVRDGNVDVVYSTVRTSFTTAAHFAAMNLDVKDYDVVVVKQGYLWPGAAELAASQVFCMTPGTSTNDFSTLPFRHLNGDYYYVSSSLDFFGCHA